MSSSLQYGYLGFLAVIMFLSYSIINKKTSRPFFHTMAFLVAFDILSVAGGGVGYLWASKELAAENAKKSTAVLIAEQVALLQSRHQKNMEPLQDLLSSASEKMSKAVFDDNRNKYREEVVSINALINKREEVFATQIAAAKSLFENVVD